MSDAVRVVTCGGGAPWEAALVRGLQRHELGVEVVRRCVDFGELMGVALHERPSAVIVSAELPWLDRDTVASLHSAGIAVVAIQSVTGARPLDRIGMSHCLDSSVTPERVVALLARLGSDGSMRPGVRATEVAPSLGVAAGDVEHAPFAEESTPRRGGRLISIWGGNGAPGRTTLALHVAVEQAHRGAEVMLIDGDAWAPALAQLAGVAESPSVTRATRLAADGWTQELATCLQDGPAGVRILAGLPRADLWPEVRERAWRAVLDAARLMADTVILDLAAPIEEDEELSFDRVPYRRNLMTKVGLEAADRIGFVIDADPIGLRRAIFAHRQLGEVVPTAASRCVPVLNRVKSNTRCHADLASELERWTGLTSPGFLPLEPTLERVRWEGCSLQELAPRSGWLRSMRELGVLVEPDNIASDADSSVAFGAESELASTRDPAQEPLASRKRRGMGRGARSRI